MTDIRVAQKQCRICGFFKHLDLFSRMKDARDGHHNICKSCDGARRRRQYYENHERELAAATKTRERRKDEVTIYLQKYRAEHKEKANAYSKRYRQENKEKILDLNRRYLANNREKIRKQGQLSYAKRKANGGTFTNDEWFALCNQFGNVCVCCGEQERLTVDHIIPITKGGTSDIGNLQPLCKSCNSRKGDRIIIDYRLPWKSVDMLRAG